MAVLPASLALLCLQWLGEQQFTIIHGRGRDDPVVPSAYLKLLVLADAALKPRVPRLPLAHTADEGEASPRPVRNRARSPRPAEPSSQATPLQHLQASSPQQQQQQQQLADLAPATPPAFAAAAPSFGPADEIIEQIHNDPEPQASFRDLLDGLLQTGDLHLFPESSQAGLNDPFSFAELPQDAGTPLAEPPTNHPRTPVGTPRQAARHASSPETSAHAARSAQQARAMLIQSLGPAATPPQHTAGSDLQPSEPCQWDMIGPSSMQSMGITDLLQVDASQQDRAAQPADQPGPSGVMHQREQALPTPSWEDIFGKFEGAHE